MFGKQLLGLLIPVALATGLGACNESTGGVQPGVVNTSTQVPEGYRGESGRVVAINEVQLRGQSGGINDGTLIGGGVGMAGGAVVGAAVGGTAGSALRRRPGGVGGAIAGTASTAALGAARHRGPHTEGRRHDGDHPPRPTTARSPRRPGMIVYNRDGVARAVRDNSYRS